MSRATRILAVTVGLVVAGALFGGVAGALTLFVSIAITEGVRLALLQPLALTVAAAVGAAIGAIAAPSAGWLLLRHVRLGKAVAVTLAGTVAGGMLGWVRHNDPVALAFLGFAVSAIGLWLRASRGARLSRLVEGSSDGR